MSSADFEEEFSEVKKKLQEAKEEEGRLIVTRQEWNTRLEEIREKQRNTIRSVSETGSGEILKKDTKDSGKLQTGQSEERERLIESLKWADKISKMADDLENRLHEVDQVLVACIRENENSVKEKMSAIFDKDGIIEY